MKKNYLLLVLILLVKISESKAQVPDSLVFSAYSEIYFGYDFSNPSDHERPSFLYNHKRHNEVNVNLAYGKIAYNSKQFRSNLALMVGNYAQYNLAAEPNLLKNIFEANIGVKISKRKNIWLDVGVLPSHIGFESAISADCWTLSRSLVAENSPYFETGIKVTSTNKKGNFSSSALLLNGWQRINRPDGTNRPSFGLQFNYKPFEGLTLNYSNFIGSDQADTLKSWRTYHNFYAVYENSKGWGITSGFDIGRDKNDFRNYENWFTPVIIVRKAVLKNSKIALRAEYFNDKNQVLVKINKNYGLQMFGVSMNYDYQISSKALFRIEAKKYFSKNLIFENNTSKENFSLLTSLSIKL